VTWIKRLLVIQDVETGDRASRAAGTAVSNRNNHALMRATVDALWAVDFAEPARATRAAERVRSTLTQMREDGSLPLETARGSRALWYQRHALASIVYIGELLAPLDENIWEPRSDDHSLHDAVAFLIKAIEDQDLVAPYARANVNPKPATDPGSQDLGFLWPRGHGRHYMAWVEIYRSRSRKLCGLPWRRPVR
jgi:poly(beta-D-mannuronate) lyase